ncbi:MAG: PhoH family protein [Blastocatellia bacterium]|nr:PhoH family protein [Blastocatellia bacterium]MCS7156893.1 PhoH family protein [Blastocatellia bacterium]MCX7752092.1 PhoH family protein [Blastocatellia bacterium]MDW8167585.1 PhoH family protein [Acidobacteriota bacterium]MDW8256185.1 PhoH family protein [Acidobacteriota bacterium]
MKKVVVAPKGIELLFGPNDQNIKLLESILNVRVDARGGDLIIHGEDADIETFQRLLDDFATLVEEGRPPSERDLKLVLRQIAEDRSYSLREHFRIGTLNPAGKKVVMARSANQLRYIQAMERSDFVFAIGPAGTGKTYLAVAMAVQMLMNKRVNRIILTRPAVEAGEKLGFLPGDLQEKVDPYLRPLYDALYDIMDYERVERFLERRVIEIAPLAFMRGRTLGDSFIILDEGQNTTSEQMKMFLTRIGLDSKVVVTGDVTQIDLPPGKRSGLVEAREILSGIEGIEFVYFTEKDVVRHPLVKAIIKAYEERNKKTLME